MKDTMISIASPVIGPEEIDAVNRVLQSGMLAQGPVVAAFEEAFAAYCGTKYAAAVNSGTAAIHAALHAAGVGAGDEVIAPPFTFMATLNPILMLGAIPKLVDIRADDYTIDPSLVEAAITPRTKAIVAVDLYGQPYDYTALQDIADRHHLALIEDACQSIGASYGDRRTGSLGRAACFSLYATKNIMSAEGGMVTTDDEAVVASVKRFRQHGMTASYEYVELGFNYRMTDILAAIGHEQLKKVDSFTADRRRNAAIFDEGLQGLPGLITPVVQPGRTHAYHQYTVRITSEAPLNRAELSEQLKAAGIGTGLYYPKPLHAYPHVQALGYKLGDFAVAEQAAAEVLSLPVHPMVSADDAGRIVAAVKAALHA
jgi:perosamine synthetase